MKDLFCIEDFSEEVLKAREFVAEGIVADEPLPQWLCRFLPIIIMALKIALFFVGQKEKEIIRAIIEGLENGCK